MKRRIAALLIVLSLAFTLASCTTKGNSSSTVKDSSSSQPASKPEQPSSKSEPQASGQTEFKVGDIIKYKDLEIIICDVSTSEGAEFIKPKEGNVFYLMNVAITNKGTEAQSISSMMMFELRSSEGVSVQQSLLAQVGVGQSGVDGAVLPGKVIRGDLGFEVAADPKGYELQVNMSVFGDKDLFSVKLDEKSENPQEPSVSQKSGKEASLGQTITSGDLEFVINAVNVSGGKNLFKPKEGNEFLLVDVTVTNKGTEAKSISSMMMFSVRDQQGFAYPMSISAVSAGKGNVDGEIMPGKSLSGELGYEAKAGTTGLELIVNPSVFDSDKIFVVTLN